VLDVGCGTSTLLAEMRSDGFRGRLVGLDVSSAAIDAARKQAPKDIEFVTGDGRNAPFPDSSFDVIIDKGTIDALLCAKNDASTHLASDAARLVKLGGRYLICSHHQPDLEELHSDPWLSIILEAVLSNHHDRYTAWHLDIHLLAQNQDEAHPTVYLFTKKRSRPPRKHSSSYSSGHDDNEEGRTSSPTHAMSMSMSVEVHEYSS